PSHCPYTTLFRSLRCDNDQGRQPSYFVYLTCNGDVLFDILETNCTAVFGHDRTGKRIPARNTLTSFNSLTITYRNGGTIGNLMTLTFTTTVIVNNDLARTRNRYFFTFGIRDITQADSKTNVTSDLRFNRTCGCCTRRRTTNVERTHR